MDVYLKILFQALIVDTPAVALEWSHNGNNRTGEHELGHPGGSPLNAPGRWSFSKCGVQNKSRTCICTTHGYVTIYMHLLLAYRW